MNEMLRSLGFGQVTNTKWTNGKTMMILVNSTNLDLICLGDIGHGDDRIIEIEYEITHSDLETMKRHVEKFIRMVGKCIQVDEG